jgi:hypothetical protein
LIDRLGCRTLQAAEIAPAAVAARIYRRSETLFRLVTDMQAWPTRKPAPK